MTIPFSLMWGGFAVFWEWSVFQENAPFFFRLWGIPFVAVGLYLIFGRFFYEARLREKTCYAVTNERILIVAGIFRRETKSLPLRTLSEISFSDRPDGEGTITFGPAGFMPNILRGSRGWPGANRTASPSFELIPDAKSVYSTIRAAQKAAG